MIRCLFGCGGVVHLYLSHQSAQPKKKANNNKTNRNLP